MCNFLNKPDTVFIGIFKYSFTWHFKTNFLGHQFLNLPSFHILAAGRKLKKNKVLSFFSFAHHLSLMDTKRHISDPEWDPIESSTALQSLSHDLCSQQLEY